jgi:hypothetical protein
VAAAAAAATAATTLEPTAAAAAATAVRAKEARHGALHPLRKHDNEAALGPDDHEAHATIRGYTENHSGDCHGNHEEGPELIVISHVDFLAGPHAIAKIRGRTSGQPRAAGLEVGGGRDRRGGRSGGGATGRACRPRQHEEGEADRAVVCWRPAHESNTWRVFTVKRFLFFGFFFGFFLTPFFFNISIFMLVSDSSSREFIALRSPILQYRRLLQLRCIFFLKFRNLQYYSTVLYSLMKWMGYCTVQHTVPGIPCDHDGSQRFVPRVRERHRK